MLVVNEIFSSIQGEGQYIGTPCTFVRLTGCNLHCKRCDTQYAFNQGKIYTEERILEIVEYYKRPLVILTGGEPLLQNIYELTKRLTTHNFKVHVETNGTIKFEKHLYVEHFTVSPKLISMRVPRGERIRPEVLEYYRDAGKAEFKFVVANKQDFDEMCKIIEKFELQPILVQPIDNDVDIATDIILWVELKKMFSTRILPQLHKTWSLK